MRTQSLNLSAPYDGLSLHSVVSLLPFVQYLETQAGMGNKARQRQLAFVLEQIRAIPGWDEPITPERMPAFTDIFELIYITVSAPITDDGEDFWAMARPFTLDLFFGTEALFGALEAGHHQLNPSLFTPEDLREKERNRLANIYSLILNTFYGVSLHFPQEMVHQAKDETTGLNHYYSISYDSRFVNVTYHGELPEINFQSIRLRENGRGGALALLMELLPLERFTFSGFSRLNIRDETPRYVIEHIKDIIVNLAPGQMIYKNITDSIKELLGTNDIDVSLMPVVKVNGRVVTNCMEGMSEEIRETCERYGVDPGMYNDAVQRYTEDPQLIMRKEVDLIDDPDEPLYKLLRLKGVKSLAVIPIFFQKTLAGILTIYSKQNGVPDESMLAHLKPAIPLLEQLLQTTIDDFNIVLDKTVKEKFTSLQPAVEWRFNEVAFDYLQRRQTDPKAQVGDIYFKDVYPLYGAIDVRNSTIERNNALRADMQVQLELLITLLDQLHLQKGLNLVNEIIYKSRKWLEHVRNFIASDDEARLELFFEDEVAPLLAHFRLHNPDTTRLIDAYELATGPSGRTHENRNALEASLQMLNRAIANLLDQVDMEIQETYPCYFEKYRSDGIEYDIYIGQSITPAKPFHALYLKNLRLWQLKSMAIVAKLTHALQAELPRPLETTQLIFIHANTIDISFRTDEHRFDVEGTYNIRYEMIKKRIDKVRIADTGERLTQPGRIALVYFNPKDVQEYLSHIHYLQDQHILAPEIEYLELEELQGVTGLKAMRVTVVLEETSSDGSARASLSARHSSG
jgi:hypothetical protein